MLVFLCKDDRTIFLSLLNLNILLILVSFGRIKVFSCLLIWSFILSIWLLLVISSYILGACSWWELWLGRIEADITYSLVILRVIVTSKYLLFLLYYQILSASVVTISIVLCTALLQYIALCTAWYYTVLHVLYCIILYCTVLCSCHCYLLSTLLPCTGRCVLRLSNSVVGAIQ